MRREAACLLAALVTAAGCGQEDDRVGAYSGPAFLTVTAVPVAGTSATAGVNAVCAGTLRVESQDAGALRGTFERLRCSGLTNPAGDVRGTLSGAVLADGTATLTFSRAPLASSEAVTTSGGCVDAPEAMGPYTGHVGKSSLSLQSRFRLGCAGRPAPAAPAFEVEYRIEARR